MLEDDTTVKSYFCPRFSLEMFQDAYGRYRIRYEVLGIVTYSEWISDYRTASMMFDMKLQDLEGN